MAKITINNLKTNTEKSDEMIDLRSETGESNLKAFTAFTTLRGGATPPKPVWPA